MRAQMVGQPFQEALSLHDFLLSVCGDPELDRLRLAVAWAKRSGLTRIEQPLRAFRERGGFVEAIVGISEGGATKQGLRFVQDMCDRAFVCYDAARTFHPKLYLALGDARAEIFIGSNNLTAGGVFWNYELGAWLSLDLADEGDAAFLQDVQSWYDSLVGEPDICLVLDDAAYSLLLDSPLYELGDEDKPPSRSGAEDTPSGQPVGGDPPGPLLFHRSRRPKRKDPLLKQGKRAPGERGGTSGTGGGNLPHAGSVIRRWVKRMSASDAQQPKTENSNITGNLKLGKAGAPIDPKTYFRHVFFGDQAWTPTATARGVREEAMVSFQTIIGGEDHGIQELKVDFAEYRVASQNNVPTWLHWNEYVGGYLRQNDHVGDFVTLEATDAGLYRLIFGSQPEGPFEDVDM